jgi:uncharacterized protein DUF6461
VFYDAVMAATAADYAWVDEEDPATFEAYCLTLARGLAPAEFLARLGASPEAPRTGISALYEPSYDVWADNERRRDRQYLFIGATAVPGDGGDWALGVEINGYLGVTREAIIPLSASTRIVSHSRSVGAVDRFYWVEDGEIRLYFEPLFPDYREGSTPDALADVMREVGFDLREDAEVEHPTEAAFALAERLTGVRVTMGLLEESRYDCGIARVP